MKPRLVTLALLLMPFWSVAQQDTKNVLFVGNSLTYFYGMPTTFSEMANAAGDKVSVSQHTVGNTGFVHHVANQTMYQLIRSKKWDYVILQPGSGESYGYTPVQTVNSYLSVMKDSILKYSPCAEIYLYEISNGVSGLTAADVTSFNNVSDRMLSTVQQICDLGKVPLVPAGEVLRNIHLKHDLMMLWEDFGNIHPNAYGSYAIACAMYNTIFKKPVSGMSVAPLRWARDLNPAQCALIQHISDSVTLQSPVEKWRQGTFRPYALFDYTLTRRSMKLESKSLNYDRLEWVFGDGTTASGAQATHFFPAGTEQTITLKAYKGTCYNSYTKTIDTQNDPAAVTDLSEKGRLEVFPVPATDKLTVRFTAETVVPRLSLTLYDLTGRKLRLQEVAGGSGLIRTDLSLAGIPSGVYLLEVAGAGELIRTRIQVN